MQYVKRYKLTIISVILILIAVLMPGSDVPSVGIPHIDKVVHFGMFGVLTLCLYGEYTWQHKRLPQYLKAWGGIEVFALLTEVAQLFVPGRSCDIADFIVDSLGILVAIIVFIVVIEKKLRSR